MEKTNRIKTAVLREGNNTPKAKSGKISASHLPSPCTRILALRIKVVK
jgi:hypothetical protein